MFSDVSVIHTRNRLDTMGRISLVYSTLSEMLTNGSTGKPAL